MLINGRYETKGVLGRGGVGVVFQATDLFMAREVAVKTMHGCPDQHFLTNSTDLSVAVPSSAVEFDAALTFPVGGMPTRISRSQHAAGRGDITLQLKPNVYKPRKS